MSDRALRTATLALAGAAVLLLLLVLLQVHNLEARFIAQGQQLRALGEATERLASGGLPTATAASASAVEPGVPPGVKLLHPDVENFLKPKETRWLPPGASLDGVLTRGWEYGDPKGLNIMLENAGILYELVDPYVSAKLARRNVWTDPDFYYGEVAWRIEVTDDAKEFTAYLRRGFKWHVPTGVDLQDPKYAWLRGDHEVTAHDFVFTTELFTNPQVESGHWRNYYAELEGARAVDDHTLVIRWKKKQYTNFAHSVELFPTARFLFTKDQDGKELPKETLGLRYNQHWFNNKGFMGAGPYRMVEYQPGSKIVLERHDGYPLEKPAIRSIVHPVYSDNKQTLLKLRAHELSVGELQPGQYREEILEHERAGRKPPNSPFFDGRIRCEKVPRLAYSYIAWNAARPTFSDRRVRLAMTYAFDRQRIIDSVWAGLGQVITGPFLPGSPSNDPAILPIPFDLAEAKRLLAEAGWVDSNGDGLVDKELHAGDGKRTPFEFRISFMAGHKESESTAKIFADDLLKIGVKMNMDALDWSLLQRKKDERQFDGYMMSWTVPWVVDLFQVWHSSQVDVPKGSNAAGFRDAEADEIIEKLRVTFDKEERLKLLHAFHRIVHREQPYVFFMARMRVFCAWNDVQNLIFSKDFPVENSLPWWVSSTSQ